MAYSVITHWMLGEALQTQEAVWLENADGRRVEHSRYNVSLPNCCRSRVMTGTDHLRRISRMDSDVSQSADDWCMLVGLHIQA